MLEELKGYEITEEKKVYVIRRWSEFLGTKIPEGFETSGTKVPELSPETKERILENTKNVIMEILNG